MNEREARSLAKLLKVARMKTDAASARLSDLRAAAAEADAALSILTRAVADEEAASAAAEIVGFRQLAGYLAGAESKRSSILATQQLIAAEIREAEADLHAAFAEVQKLDHVVERSRDAIAKRRQKSELAMQGDAAIARRRRASDV